MSITQPAVPDKSHDRSVYVWDPLVRLGHWSLVVVFTIAYLSGDEDSRLHEVSGYIVLGLVLFRTLWGFVGTRHARFNDFVYRPRVVLAYARDMLAGRARRYIGHNPLGGVMILLLLASLAATSVTGWLLLPPDEARAALPAAVATSRHDDGDLASREKRDARHDTLEEVHEFLANFTLLLVVLHIGGVIFSSLAHRENLVAAMISGRKHG